MVAATALLLSLVSFSAVSATPVARIIHESRAAAPSLFTHAGAASPDSILRVRINLAQNNIDGLEKALLAASTPSSPSYGQWLSSEQVRPQYLHVMH